ncbi:MAG: hypothetical protein MJ089_05380 [Ruminococcus sp.]|nr:hypothetical protein [Ruminococcus sp.]
MNQIEKQLDRIIVGLKRIESLKGVRFVREYGSHYSEIPVSGFLAVVSLKNTSQSKNYIGGYLSSVVKGDNYSADAEIRVYAPASENGNGLSEIVSEIFTGLKKADNEKLIANAKIAPIDFDADINAIFRVVSFHMSFYLCEEVL